MQKYRTIFNQYFKRFDMREKHILSKFHHTYRVVEYAKETARSLKLNEHDTWLSEMIGLFHDIGRFEQWTKYSTFSDQKSIDHATLACKILEEEKMLDDLDSNDKKIILDAIENHNKYEINNIDDDRTLLFCKIIRDADKLDILFEQDNTIDEKQNKLSSELLNQIYNKKPCLNEYVKTDVDRVIRHMGFIVDLNFKYSFKLLKEKEWFKNKFNLLENYVEDLDEVTKLKEFINNYVEEKILC